MVLLLTNVPEGEGLRNIFWAKDTIAFVMFCNKSQAQTGRIYRVARFLDPKLAGLLLEYLMWEEAYLRHLMPAPAQETSTMELQVVHSGTMAHSSVTAHSSALTLTPPQDTLTGGKAHLPTCGHLRLVPRLQQAALAAHARHEPPPARNPPTGISLSEGGKPPTGGPLVKAFLDTILLALRRQQLPLPASTPPTDTPEQTQTSPETSQERPSEGSRNPEHTPPHHPPPSEIEQAMERLTGRE
ncbi:hypothetical protein BT69DRAFT_1328443 [Atractiella rhizophila]|nr:hypothetical protein BT69DRAFT_1328443 [Atractiella rhizophila]